MNFKVTSAIAVTVFFWASAFIGNKYALQYFAPAQLAFLRYAIASLLFLVPFSLGNIRLPARKDMGRIVATGFFGIAFYNMLLYYGQRTVPAGTASLLVNTAPVFTTLLSVLWLKEKVKPWGWLGLAISFIGVVFIVLGKNASLQLDAGSLLVLGSAISFSIYFITQKPLLTTYKSIEVVAYAIWSGTLLLLPAAFTLPSTMVGAGWTPNLVAIYLGIFPGAVAYLTWAVVNAHLPASVSASFLYLTPVLSFIFSYWVFGEVPTTLTATGGCIAIGGVFVINKWGK